MKKIINGKKYDTDTAKFLLSRSNNCTGFSYCYEELYLKKTGEFFLYGKGGAMSKYSRSCGDNTWCGGEEIVPLTEAKAKKFVEEYGDADDYEKIFGEVEE